MKIIAKTKAILIATKAESMSEVVVAFLVLSIIMVVFVRGITFAGKAESNAIDNVNTSDDAMIRLQKVVTDQDPKPAGVSDETVDAPGTLDGHDLLKLKKYTVSYSSGGDTNSYIYYVFDAKLG